MAMSHTPSNELSPRARLREQAARAAARAGGVASLAVVLLGAPAMHHMSSQAPSISHVQRGADTESAVTTRSSDRR